MKFLLLALGLIYSVSAALGDEQAARRRSDQSLRVLETIGCARMAAASTPPELDDRRGILSLAGAHSEAMLRQAITVADELSSGGPLRAAWRDGWPS